MWYDFRFDVHWLDKGGGSIKACVRQDVDARFSLVRELKGNNINPERVKSKAYVK